MSNIDEALANAFQTLQQSKNAEQTPSKPVPTQQALLNQFLTLHSLLASNDAYSLNETIKELPADSLRYLVVQYELANLWQNQPILPVSADAQSSQSSQSQTEARILQASSRRKQLNKSVTTFLSFLSTCDHLEALTDEDRTAYLTIKMKFEGSMDHVSSQASNPASVRAAKIAKFKQNRELEEKMSSFEAKHSTELFAESHSKPAAQSSVTNDADSDLEEQLRDYWLARIQHSINKALESIPLCLQEQEFLIERETRERQDQQNPQSNHQTPRQSQQQPTQSTHKPLVYNINSASQLHQPIPDHMKQYLQHVQPAQPAMPIQSSEPSSNSQSVVKTLTPTTPFDMQNLLTSVNQLNSRPTRETVFRNPNPPGMSVEEWADREIAAGRMPGPSAPVRVNERRGYVKRQDDSDQQNAGDEDEQDLVGQFGGENDRQKEEAKTMAAREWDNWKDDHERGAGNRNGGR